jgi:acyl-CoA thioester hydrolase
MKTNIPDKIVTSNLRVRYAETDAMGIVYHANYLIWMEVGRTDYFRALGFAYRDLEQQFKLQTPLAEISCRYLAPAHYDDEILVLTCLRQLNRRLIRFGYSVVRASDNLKLAEGESVHLMRSYKP